MPFCSSCKKLFFQGGLNQTDKCVSCNNNSSSSVSSSLSNNPSFSQIPNRGSQPSRIPTFPSMHTTSSSSLSNNPSSSQIPNHGSQPSGIPIFPSMHTTSSSSLSNNSSSSQIPNHGSQPSGIPTFPSMHTTSSSSLSSSVSSSSSYFYGETKNQTQSTISQPTFGPEKAYCFMYAPCAAIDICRSDLNDFLQSFSTSPGTFLTSIGGGASDNGNKIFKKAGLKTFTVLPLKISNSKLKKMIKYAIKNGICISVAISWPDTIIKNGKKVEVIRQHVIYAIGYEGQNLIARDQQLAHVSIEFSMDTWECDFDLGKGIMRRLTVENICFGAPSDIELKKLMEIYTYGSTRS